MRTLVKVTVSPGMALKQPRKNPLYLPSMKRGGGSNAGSVGQSFPILAYIAAALMLFACQHPHKNPFLEGLPPKAFEQAGPLVIYNRINLFHYMNGEAEIYLPRGFKLLYTQVYEKKDTGARMTAEVYHMSASDGASAVLRKFSEEGGTRITDLGDAAWTDSLQVLFQRGSFYTKVFPDPSPENGVKPTLEEMLALSRALDEFLQQ